jgi:hypothetical protein
MSSTSMVAQNYKITVMGKVCNQLGHGIPDVVVNDGENFVKTDMKGEYRIVADTTKSKFVAISTPAEYSSRSLHRLGNIPCGKNTLQRGIAAASGRIKPGSHHNPQD